MVEESVLKTDNRANSSAAGSSPVPSFSCIKCNQSFVDSQSLANHVRWSHLGSRYIHCSRCGKKLVACGFKSHQKVCKGKKLCLQCGEELKRKSTKKFCSQSCSVKFSNHRRARSINIKSVCCKICSKPFDVDSHTHNNGNVCPSCKVISKNKKVAIRNLVQVRKSLFCLNCGAEIYGKKGKVKYCSRNCSQDHRNKVLIKYIEEKNGFGVSARRLKKYLIVRYGVKCFICNATEWNNKPIPLVLDHINGRAFDNRLENVRLACGNCDMLLPTYKSKNKESDRIFRKKYTKKAYDKNRKNLRSLNRKMSQDFSKNFHPKGQWFL